MAPKKKLGQILIKLVSQAQTGFFYVTKKNPRNVPHKLQLVKYDPVVNKHVLFTEAKLKWNFTASPGWTKEEANLLRLCLMKYGVGQWQQIQATGLLPGKMVQQLNGQAQRLLGQQSLAPFTGLRVDVDAARRDNAAKQGPGVQRKSGLVVWSGPNPTREMKAAWQAESKAKYGLSEEQLAAVDAELEAAAAAAAEAGKAAGGAGASAGGGDASGTGLDPVQRQRQQRLQDILVAAGGVDNADPRALPRDVVSGALLPLLRARLAALLRGLEAAAEATAAAATAGQEQQQQQQQREQERQAGAAAAGGEPGGGPGQQQRASALLLLGELRALAAERAAALAAEPPPPPPLPAPPPQQHQQQQPRPPAKKKAKTTVISMTATARAASEGTEVEGEGQQQQQQQQQQQAETKKKKTTATAKKKKPAPSAAGDGAASGDCKGGGGAPEAPSGPAPGRASQPKPPAAKPPPSSSKPPLPTSTAKSSKAPPRPPPQQQQQQQPPTSLASLLDADADALCAMGFSRRMARDALAEVGPGAVDEAVAWLLAHCV